MRYFGLMLVFCCSVANAQVANVKVDIDGKNDPPSAVDDTYETDQDTVLIGNVLSNDTDPDINDVTIVVEVNGQAFSPGESIGLPSGAILIINSDGTFEYNPNDVFDGLKEGEKATDSFTYKIVNPPAEPLASMLKRQRNQFKINRMIFNKLIALRTGA